MTSEHFYAPASNFRGFSKVLRYNGWKYYRATFDLWYTAANVSEAVAEGSKKIELFLIQSHMACPTFFIVTGSCRPSFLLTQGQHPILQL